ncbi:endonuclease/exonuclease/phosphatase family protein [Nonomuraea rhizosphaerae]|uniref:endonuclease/exonuclease/phosphatase family protein n=1 Tax=Nonomuraea rhizosphaerae TaxID=2665663 RepID=UPI001C5FE221|nr:endonuclease/exonuclease/phosphatase family protein [Nonomuraea rhizosphaerae]
MMGDALLALLAEPRTDLTVTTWNVCAGTNPACALYRQTPAELAHNIGQYVTGQPGPPDVIFLQEFCTGAGSALELWLEQRTGRRWTVGSWGLTAPGGGPYACHPDRLGRSRGAQSVTVAVADDAVTFQGYPLASPPWYAGRGVLCATLPARKVRACATHLSSGAAADDRQPGAPYRTRQLERLLAVAARPGYRGVLGGDLNTTPRRRIIAPLYRAYEECDPRRRWTRAGKKLDYLFAPKGTVRGCRLDRSTTLSDHQPLTVKVAL